jgi:hypothetical protein
MSGLIVVDVIVDRGVNAGVAADLTGVEGGTGTELEAWWCRYLRRYAHHCGLTERGRRSDGRNGAGGERE